MPVTPSVVWKYFRRSEKIATCTLCEAELAYQGTTTNLRNHLRNKHPSTSIDNPTVTTQQKKQTSISSFVKTPRKLLSGESERITQSICNMVVKDYMPLSVVGGAGFRELMDNVAPQFKIPCRNTIRSRIIQKYDSGKEQLVSELESISAVAITTDTWTSNSTESYLTVTEHHIDNDWTLKSNVLLTRAMPERHTGENLANRLKDCVAEFGIMNKVETCVHDNARNMDCAGRQCDQWNDLGCFGHTLQLCIKPALELPTVSKIVSRCRKLVGHFKHSTTVTAAMRERQTLLNHPKHELIQDVATRWNSTQLMLQRLQEQRRVITDIMLDTTVTNKRDSVMLLKDNEWDIVIDLCEVLGVLTDVTTYMCADKYVSCSEIYPIVCGVLSGCLKHNGDDNGLIVKVKDTIRGELTQRFKPSDFSTATSVPVIAALLDPRYKRLPFLTTEQRKVAEEQLESHIDELPLKVNSSKTSIEPTPKRRKLDFLVYSSPEKNNRDELVCYLREKMDPDSDPLQWWKKHELDYPSIAIVARKFLCVPATSVPSERIFSAAGLLINKLRNRLSSDIVDSIIFLNKNAVL